MNNNPNNYKFDPNTGEALFNQQPAQPEQPVVQPQPVTNQTTNTFEQPVNNNQNNGYVPPIGPGVQSGYVPPVQPEKPVYGINNNPNYTSKKKGSKFGVIFFYIFILAIIGAAVAAFLIPKKSSEPKDLTRTIMIYMVGSDLESKAGYGSLELDAIDYDEIDNENINVVLIAGGSKVWHNDYVDVDETSIFELKRNGFEKVKKQSVKNMADDKVFSDFLTYVYENYKSDRYDLIFWDHGAAILGSELDQLHNNDILSLKEIRRGLKNSPFNEDNKLEVVIFSTCLNGTIEVADTFKDHANYLVASEETTSSVPGGSDFAFIANIESTDKGYDFAYKFVDGYKNKIKKYYNGVGYSQSKAYSTYSIIDLTNVGELVDAVNEFFGDIDIADNYNTIARVRSNIYQYPIIDANYDMVDLYNLVDGLKDLSPKKAQKVLDIFEKTVSYNWATNSKSRGLSIYFPYKSHQNYVSTFKIIYNDLNNFTEYSRFINKFDAMHSSGSSYSKSYQDNKTNVNYKNGKGDFTLELTDEQLETFASAKYLVFRDNKDGTYKPFYMNGTAYLDGNTLKAAIRGKQLVITFEKDEDGLDKYPLILDELDDDENYTRYVTHVILEDFRDENLNWIMDRADITLIYNKKTGKIEISDVTPSVDDENNTPARVSLNISDYQYVAFSASSSYSIDENNDFVSNGVITGYEIGVDEFDFELADFDDGYDYYAVFVIEDTYGNKSKSKLIKMN